MHTANECFTYPCIKKLPGIINEMSVRHNNKSSLIDCLKINNVLKYDAAKITNKFGEYFSSVGKDFAKRFLSPNMKLITIVKKFLETIRAYL